MKAFEKIARFSDLGGVIGNEWLGSAQDLDGSAPVDLHWSDVLELVGDIKAEHAINQQLSGENERLIEMCVKARAETARLREALGFYANPETWQADGHPQIDANSKTIFRDGGKVARDALAGGE
ncbi:hypothetical protein TH8_19700 [Thalassospira profundimaris]|nr:hypothetical protein TH8_19700 [Thalassospira profundimaris]